MLRCRTGLFVLFFVSISTLSFAQSTYKRTLKLMGSRFDITVVADSKEQSQQYINKAVAEINRIETLISSWDPHSQTSAINKNAGFRSVKVAPELYNLIARSLQISKLTAGAFDISYASMDAIWQFDGSVTTMPSSEKIKNSVANVDYQNIVLEPKDHRVFLTKKGMKIGFGAIGKGYAADAAKKVLQKAGVVGGIINASGDMNTWGVQPDGAPWKVGITNPLNKNKVFAFFSLQNNAVVTSGNYEKFVVLDGKRYSHIIDPRTGMPSTGLVSVSVFAPSAELADALATAIFVMGTEVGINLINQLPNIACVLVTESGEIRKSNHIDRVNYKKETHEI